MAEGRKRQVTFFSRKFLQVNSTIDFEPLAEICAICQVHGTVEQLQNFSSKEVNLPFPVYGTP